MVKRTTIEIDQELLERARRALGEATTRGTVERALRVAADSGEAAKRDRAEKQRRYFRELKRRADLRVLGSDRMWK